MSQKHIFIAGNPVKGFSFFGPFDEQSDAYNYAECFGLAGWSCPIHAVKDEVSGDKVILVVGEIEDGYNFYGPFAYGNDASEFAEDSDEWFVAEIVNAKCDDNGNWIKDYTKSSATNEPLPRVVIVVDSGAAAVHATASGVGSPEIVTVDLDNIRAGDDPEDTIKALEDMQSTRKEDETFNKDVTDIITEIKDTSPVW